MVRVIIRDDSNGVATWAAAHIKDAINNFKPTAERPFVLGLPTGSSPIGTYTVIFRFYLATLIESDFAEIS